MTIGDFSMATGIPESTLRYYEKKGLIRITRKENGHRNYSEADISWVQFIKKLKDTGMRLKDIQRYSDLRYQGDETISERLQILQVHKTYVDEQCEVWNHYSQNLEHKLDFYRKKLEK